MSTEPVPSGSAQSSEEATVAEPRIRSETEAPSRGSSGPLPLQNSEGSSWARVRVLAMAGAADLMSRWDDRASRGPLGRRRRAWGRASLPAWTARQGSGARDPGSRSRAPSNRALLLSGVDRRAAVRPWRSLRTALDFARFGAGRLLGMRTSGSVQAGPFVVRQQKPESLECGCVPRGEEK